MDKNKSELPNSNSDLPPKDKNFVDNNVTVTSTGPQPTADSPPEDANEEPGRPTSNSGEDLRNQGDSTSQNNDKIHNEKRNSSSTFFSSLKKIIMGKEVPDDGETVEIIFRVHLPKVRSGEPVVVGSIEELGNWKKPKVKLKQYKKGWNYSSDSSYWYSEPIRIPIKRFKETVEYKYAVYFSNGDLQFEGHGKHDNRGLEIQCQIFDIWNNNYFHRIDRITDYMFLDIIYESATLENIKDDILDYDNILKQHRELTLSVTNIPFISKRLSDTSIGKRLFLCFLLGHCPNKYGKYELPRDFQSNTLLQALFTIDSEKFPKDNWHVVLKGLDLLIHHNINNGSHVWLEIFKIARKIDPQYNFIETITFAKCNDDRYIKTCFEIVLSHEMDENNHVKIIKWLMSQCKNVKILSFVWRSSNRNDEQLRQYLIENIKKIISKDDADNLHRNFKELPDEIRDKASGLFRKRALDILKNARRAVLNKSSYQSIFDLLNSAKLRWTKEEYIVVLEIVSTLEDYQLSSVFPSLLENWIQMSKEIDNKIARICTQWYKKLLNLMDRKSQSSSHLMDHKEEYVTAIFEKFSNICTIVNEQSILDDLMEITINRIRQSSETSIFSATTKIVNLRSEAVHVFTKVIKEKIDSMELNRDKYLLKKMQAICGCT
ncbi:396_t:CDS:2, partial [Funneliformis mosseae]